MTDSFLYADKRIELFSHVLHKVKMVEVFLPPHFSSQKKYGLLLLNDGQDVRKLKVKEILHDLYSQKILKELVVVAVHASNRMREYGVAEVPDCQDRGDKAHLYHHFVVHELLPFLQRRFHLDPNPDKRAIAGMSLGGLSAIDLAINYPHKFKRVGVFSGSFWWRSREIGNGYQPNDRIMHRQINEMAFKEGMKFWLQVGTKDETSDRNKSGIIDAIEDTLDLIQMLKYKGYVLNTDIRFVQLEGGKHDYPTWSVALPDFLLWNFGVSQKTSINNTA